MDLTRTELLEIALDVVEADPADSRPAWTAGWSAPRSPGDARPCTPAGQAATPS